MGGNVKNVLQEFGVSVSFYRATYLVDVVSVQGKNILRLEVISKNGKAWQNADVLSFNTGHWWTHKGSLQGSAILNLSQFFLKHFSWFN